MLRPYIGFRAPHAAYTAANSAPHCPQYHSVGRFIVPHSLHRSVRATSSSPAADGSGTIGAGTGLAARCDGGTAARGGSDGMLGWNWAPLARRADGAAPVSSSVTDLMNSSSSTWAGFAGGSRGMRGRSWGVIV